MASAREAHFVYLGATLPKYAFASVEPAVTESGLKVHLKGNRIIAANTNRGST